MTVRLEGADGLRRALKRMDQDLAGQVLKEAIDDGAEILLHEMRALAPRGKTGNLIASIKRRKARKRRSGHFLAEVGPRGKKGAHAHLVEFGHRVVRGGKVVGFARPVPFIRRSVRNVGSRVIARVAEQIRRGVDRAWR